MFKEQEINKLSKQYKCSCNIFYDAIYINSIYRSWICEQQGQYLRLKHLNGEQCKHKNHVHEKKYTDLESIFKYINKHDNQVIPDRNRNKRVKLERLFASIHR